MALEQAKKKNAIGNVVYFILESLHRSQEFSSVFCDFLKAFDSLRHDILIKKLEYYGFKYKELNLM